jgi:hypothetical protein
MNKVEEIKLKEKDKYDLPNVEFVPPRFGAFMLSCLILGIGIGLMASNFAFGLANAFVGLFGVFWMYSKRSEW